MKIGILTFHRCINYGSYWQARCLVDELQKRGHSAFILNHQSEKVNFAEWKCALQPVLPTPVPRSDYPLYRQKVEKFFIAIESLPLSAPFPLENPSQMEEYDLVIAGSDEIWNLSHPWYGYYPIFYGEGVRSKRLISYAVSFGNFQASSGIDRIWGERLKKFQKISVRDSNSREIIKKTLGFEPEVALDPCLQFPIQSEQGQSLEEEPYAIVYGHNFSPSIAQITREWADNRKLPLISLGYRNDWAHKQKLTAGPFEFISFMAHSEAIITNFFHGCIFALINSKPYVCEISPYRGNKIQDLLQRVGGENHLVNGEITIMNFSGLLEGPLEESIYQNVDSLRRISGAWLDKALEDS